MWACGFICIIITIIFEDLAACIASDTIRSTDMNRKSYLSVIKRSMSSNITCLYPTVMVEITLLLYKAHHMAVHAIHWNAFHRDVFASCGADWTVKIWDHNFKLVQWMLCMHAVLADFCSIISCGGIETSIGRGIGLYRNRARESMLCTNMIGNYLWYCTIMDVFKGHHLRHANILLAHIWLGVGLANHVYMMVTK